MPFAGESLLIIFVIFGFGAIIAFLVNAYPHVKYFVDTMMEARADLKKFKKKQPVEL
jgi:hypothetical protein